MSNVLITGSNRGLGLEFVRQYAQEGWRVYACCRTPSAATALQQLAEGSGGKISVHALDVADHAQIEALATELGAVSLDLLINNAGVFGDRRGFGHSDYETWNTAFRVNTFGPMKMAESFLAHLERGEKKLLVNITSKMGSMADNTSGGSYAYRSSKAALNMVTMSQSHDLRGRGIITTVLHPGWVATNMGGSMAPLQTPESVAGMCKVIAGLSMGDTGKFFNYSGEEIPW